MDVQMITNKETWENGLLSHNSASFLHSWDWSKFQATVGNTPLRLGLFHEGKILAQMLAFEHKVAKGLVSYYYLPRFQVYRDVKDAIENPLQVSKEIYRDIFLEHLHRQGKGSYIRLEPVEDMRKARHLQLHPVKSRQPQHSLLLDISKDDETLLAEMHKKTRYNIRLAEKKGVTISSEKNIDLFWQLNEETTARDGFSSHNKAYYERMLALPICHQLTAYVDGKAIASNLMMLYGNTCTYVHGASSNSSREYMATYLLQWEGMQLGKAGGCKQYDFWGTAPWKTKDEADAMNSHGHYWDASHPLSGVTRFKAGFGGKEVRYGQAVEIPIKEHRYKFIRLLKRFV